jgi:hypothetical protein
MARGGDRQAQWQARFARWRRSGQTVREFCADERVSVPSFYYWRRRLPVGDHGLAKGGQRGGDAVGGAPATFVPVEVIGSVDDGMSAEYRFPSGVSLRISSGVEESRLRALLRVLREERL